jgi:hypothetical protein
MPFPSKRHELASRFNCEAYLAIRKRLLPDDDSKTHYAPGSAVDRATSWAQLCARCALATIP